MVMQSDFDFSNDHDEFIDDPDFIEGIDVPCTDLSREKKIELTNQALFMNHRSSPYNLSNGDDFKEFFKFLIATYMDYNHYFISFSDVLEEFLHTLQALEPSIWELIDSGEYEYIQEGANPFIDVYQDMFCAHDSLLQLTNRARNNAEAILKTLFQSPITIQEAVLGQSYYVPDERLDIVSKSLAENIFELAYAHGMEENRDTFVRHINKNMKQLLQRKRPIKMKRREFVSSKPKLSTSLKPDSVYLTTELNDMKELFLITVGRYMDYNYFWSVINNVYSDFDETLEYADPSTYISIIVFKDNEDTIAEEVMSDLGSCESNMSELVHNVRKMLVEALIHIFANGDEWMAKILGCEFRVPVEKIESILDSFFTNTVFLNHEYCIEDNRDIFLEYFRDALQDYKI